MIAGVSFVGFWQCLCVEDGVLRISVEDVFSCVCVGGYYEQSGLPVAGVLCVSQRCIWVHLYHRHRRHICSS